MAGARFQSARALRSKVKNDGRAIMDVENDMREGRGAADEEASAQPPLEPTKRKSQSQSVPVDMRF